MRNRRYSDLRGEPVLEDHHAGHDLGALQVGDVVALDPERHLVELERLLDLLERPVADGQVAGALGLVEREGLLGVVGDGLLERLLVATLRDPDPDLRLPYVREQLLEGLVVGRQRRNQDLARDRLSVLAGVELEQEVLDQGGSVGVVHPVRDPTALALDAAAAYVEDLHTDLERVLGQGDHVGVGTVAEHHGLLLQGTVHRGEVVTQPRGLLEVEGLGLRRTSPSRSAW